MRKYRLFHYKEAIDRIELIDDAGYVGMAVYGSWHTHLVNITIDHVRCLDVMLSSMCAGLPARIPTNART